MSSASKTASPMTRTVAILEDTPDFSDYLCQIVERAEGLDLAFVTDRISDCLSQLASFPALDLLLVDLQLPDGSGLTVIETAAQRPDLKILVLTVLADRNSVLKALELGADGYLLKDSPPEQITGSITAALDGGSPVSPQAAAHLFNVMRRSRPATGPEQLAAGARPTPREAEIVQLLAKGLTYAEVARIVGLSTHTVGDHVKAVYRKLGVSSRSEAVYEARALGWLSLLD
jgi:DNA-binding NarL/FixJ family response regulator